MQNLLNDKQQAAIPIAVFTASGETEKLKTALSTGLNSGMTISEIKEILVQLYAYAGFPRSLNALGTLMSVLALRRKEGLEDEPGREATPVTDRRSSLERGTENQTKLVGQPVKGPLFEFAPVIDEYLKSHLFGDIFQRDVLDWQTRELATISALAAMTGVNSQLQSHYGISLNTGLTAAQLRAFVDVLQQQCGNAIAANASAVLDSVLANNE